MQFREFHSEQFYQENITTIPNVRKSHIIIRLSLVPGIKGSVNNRQLDSAQATEAPLMDDNKTLSKPHQENLHCNQGTTIGNGIIQGSKLLV